MRRIIDHHISIIGTNPLPAYITLLKNCNENTNIYLVHTTESKINFGTKKVAENLKEVLEEKIPNIRVNLVSCDKSNVDDISKSINRILRDIKNNMREKDSYRLLLDYTGGTKAMAALFAEKVYIDKTEGLIPIISYVYDVDNTRVILEDSRFIVESGSYDLKDIVNKLNISIEEITRIHGYWLEQKLEEKVYRDNIAYLKSSGPIVFTNERGAKLQVDEVHLLNGRLLLCFESKYLKEGAKKKKLKMELFEFKDIANKLGGDKSMILYKCKFSENKNMCRDEHREKQKNLLMKDLKASYEFDMEYRLKFVSPDTSFKDEVTKMYINEGGK